MSSKRIGGTSTRPVADVHMETNSTYQEILCGTGFVPATTGTASLTISGVDNNDVAFSTSLGYRLSFVVGHGALEVTSEPGALWAGGGSVFIRPREMFMPPPKAPYGNCITADVTEFTGNGVVGVASTKL